MKMLRDKKPEKSTRGLMFGAAVLGIALGGVWVSQTQQPFPHVRVVKSQSSQASSAGVGQKAYRDPVTGEFREPTADEAAALAALQGTQTGAASSATEIGSVEGGGVAMLLPESAQMSVAAVRNPDGSISYVHAPVAKGLPSPAGSVRKETANDR